MASFYFHFVGVTNVLHNKMTFYICSSLKRSFRIVYKDLDLVTVNYGINLISEERQCAVNLGTF